jgi:hypothetical protein
MAKTFRLKYVVIAIAAAALLGGGVAQAVNNRPPSANDNAKLNAALVTIEKEKAKNRAAVSKAMAKELTPLEKEWGIKLYGIRWTAGGYMLEMKFRVLDPDKAFPLLKRHTKRYLFVEKSGAVLEVPFSQKLGSLKSTVRTSNMVRKDRNYLALFANPGKHVKPGDKVDLVVGNFMAEGLTVQ